MNGEKPLNILADQEIKPDIEVKTEAFKANQNSPLNNLKDIPVPPPPKTALQDELANTLNRIVPGQKPAVEPTIPKPPQSPADEQKVFVQKPIRTYEGDIAELMSRHKTSVATIAIAESEKKEGVPTISSKNDEPKKNYTKQILLSVASIVLILGGIVGGYYLYTKSAFSIPKIEPKPMPISSLIPPDTQTTIIVTKDDGAIEIINAIYSQINKITNVNGENNEKIFELILGEKKVVKDIETITKITGSNFIKKIKLNLPDTLERTLMDQWMIGFYIENGNEKTPFVILKTDFFQNAFSGMLSWEQSMPDDLANLLNYKEKARAMESTDSNQISSYFSIRGKFIDKEIKNRDVREFIGNSGQTLFLYSFLDKDTIIITTKENLLEKLIERIEKQTYIR